MIRNVLKLVSYMSSHMTERDTKRGRLEIDRDVNHPTLCWFAVNLNNHFPFWEDQNELMVCQANLT